MMELSNIAVCYSHGSVTYFTCYFCGNRKDSLIDVISVDWEIAVDLSFSADSSYRAFGFHWVALGNFK